MPRPRNKDPRLEQINLRFSALEFARIHRNASITGKTVPEFGRAALLRKPRPTRKNAPALLSLPPTSITRWHAEGLSLNAMAYRFNAADTIDLPLLPAVVRNLRSLLRRSFPTLATDTDQSPAYSLHPAVRYHVRRICTNLVQIADRYRALDLAVPVPLSNLIGRFRLILNHDRAHGS